MSPVPVVSVCVATRGASPKLERLLGSLAVQTGGVAMELLVASDGDPRVSEMVGRIVPTSFVAITFGAPPGSARNTLIPRARGNVLWFLDDDVVVPPGALARLATVSRERPAVNVFGGPNLAPPESGFFERVQSAALGSLLGLSLIHI